ncbi:phosphotransferase family protein [Brachybacterium sp. AOP43-C2-M15]|uniref:phosphotransferase family protein n=1 Tax=Brachybacterium sp. AOP43-C2-M15 TaxID=3457661 RepID=UPI0040347557
MEEVEVVVAHSARATLRVGEVYLKVDGDAANAGIEARAMELAPVPTPRILWHEPPVLAIAAVPGTALGTLGGPSTASPAAWAATGAAVRALHDAPPPPWEGTSPEEVREELDRECAWLLENAALPADVVRRNREIADAALRPWTPRFIHGDLQIAHVFVDDDDEVAGIIDWSGAAPGDAMFDLATLTLGHEEQLEPLLAGYGDGADREVIRAWWSLRSLTVSRWLIEHGFDPDAPGCEFDVLRARMANS